MYSFWKQGAQARYDNVGTGTFGQTFKATAPFVLRAGVNLNGVSGAPASVVVRIRQGGPTGAVVATSPATAVVQWGETTATFPKTALTVGALYYLEGVWASGANLQVWSSTTNDYPDGDGFLNGAPRGYDLNARITGRTS